APPQGGEGCCGPEGGDRHSQDHGTEVRMSGQIESTKHRPRCPEPSLPRPSAMRGTILRLPRLPSASPGTGNRRELEPFDASRHFLYSGNEDEERTMEDAGIGWIAAIIIGGLAGWIASNFMNSNTGILANIILGIVGAAIASFLLGLLGVSFGGWLG